MITLMHKKLYILIYVVRAFSLIYHVSVPSTGIVELAAFFDLVLYPARVAKRIVITEHIQ